VTSSSAVRGDGDQARTRGVGPDREPEVEASSLLVAVLDDDDLPLYF
jgi:hypothetical protein